LDNITVLMWEDTGSGDHAAVAVVSDIAAAKSLPTGTPVVLLSDPSSEAINA
jgi:hypothetical protein